MEKQEIRKKLLGSPKGGDQFGVLGVERTIKRLLDPINSG